MTNQTAPHRSVRGRTRAQADAFDGLPDVLPDTPPKASEYTALTLDQAIARAHAILDTVLAGITVPRRPGCTPALRKLDPPDQVFTLFSGGGDSSILAHLMRQRTDGLVHVRTGISVPATWDYVQAVAHAWNLPLHAAHPDDTYDDLVLGRVTVKTDKGTRPKGTPVWQGFPGPAGHHMMYTRLKERALERFRNSLTGGRGRSGQIVFLGGMRWAESDRRFRNAAEWDQWGSVIWCSPIVWWTDSHMAEYRARYLCHDTHDHAPGRLCRPDALPRSEVTDHLHMSGDCLCGAYAKPGELAQVAFFYPEVAARIRALEAQAEAAGIRRCVWGAGKQPGDKSPGGGAGRLCTKCVAPAPGQGDLFDEWLAAGLLTADQHTQLTAA